MALRLLACCTAAFCSQPLAAAPRLVDKCARSGRGTGTKEGRGHHATAGPEESAGWAPKPRPRPRLTPKGGGGRVGSVKQPKGNLLTPVAGAPLSRIKNDSKRNNRRIE